MTDRTRRALGMGLVLLAVQACDKAAPTAGGGGGGTRGTPQAGTPQAGATARPPATPIPKPSRGPSGPTATSTPYLPTVTPTPFGPTFTPTPFLPTPFPTPPAPATDLTGAWHDDLGRTFSLVQVGTRVTATVTGGDACYDGAPAYFDGQLDGTTLYGTLAFCPDPGLDDAVTVCGYPARVTTTFRAELFPGEIDGLYDAWDYRAYPCDQSDPVPTYLGLYRD